jgi:ubiquinone biosynthesis protein UbiJ
MAEAGEQTVSARQLDARQRWRDTIAARIAGFQTLIDDHQEQAVQGLLPQEELDWVAKEIRGWTRHLETLTARIEQLQEERA